MSSPSQTEAGPSSQSPTEPAPTFKKRNRGAGRPPTKIAISTLESTRDHDLSSRADESSPDAPTQAVGGDAEEDDSTSVQDLIALRALSRKPLGIELERLNKGEKKKKKKRKDKDAAKSAEEKWEEQMRKGGLVTSKLQDGDGEDDEDDDEEENAEETKKQTKRLVRKDNFQGETGTVDVDKHMMAYIESEMRKRMQAPGQELPSGDRLAAAVNDPEDELYRVAEKYRALQSAARPEPKSQEEDEGNVTLSAAMLSSIPEIDLGMDTRLKNIEETERAKRALYEKRKAEAGGGSLADEDYAATRFFRPQHRMQSDAEVAREFGVTEGEEKPVEVPSKRRSDHRPMASDQAVMDRFKKRQRNQLK